MENLEKVSSVDDRLMSGILISLDQLSRLVGISGPKLWWELRGDLDHYTAASAERRPAIAKRALERIQALLPRISRQWLIACGSPEEDLAFRGSRSWLAQGSLVERLQAFLQPRAIDCIVALTSPRSVVWGESFELRVGFDLDRSQRPGRLSVEPGQLVTLRLGVYDANIEIETPVREVIIDADAMPFEIVYCLRACRPGRSQLFLILSQNGCMLADPRLIEIDVKADRAGSEGEARSEQDFRAHQQGSPQADLVIQAFSPKNSGRIEIELDFDNSEASVISGSVEFTASPEQYWEGLCRRLSEALRAGDSRGVELRRIGAQVYEELFPAELRPAFEGLLAKGIHTIQIDSGLSWMPWELMLPPPMESSLPRPAEEEFLGNRCAIARWYRPDAGGTRSRSMIDLQRAVLVIPFGLRQGPLPGAKLESTNLEEEFRRRGVACERVEPTDYKTLLKRLSTSEDPPFDLWHFASHGHLDFTRPDEAPILLDGDSQIRPVDLYREPAKMLRQARPLVFLNACRLGHTSWGITSLGGWPSRLMAAGVGAVIAPLWAVADLEACQFAQAFYAQLPRGRERSLTLGEAVLNARRACGFSPTAMAYVAYGDVNALIGTVLATEIDDAAHPTRT